MNHQGHGDRATADGDEEKNPAMRLITIEEHTLDRAVARASTERSAALSPHFQDAYDPSSGLVYSPTPQVLEDLDGAGTQTWTLMASICRFCPA